MICLQTTCENLRLCVIVLRERIDWKHILGPHSAIIVSLPIAGFALPLQSMSHWNELLSTCSSVDEGFYCIGLCVFSKYVAGLTITSGNFDASGSTGDRPWLLSDTSILSDWEKWLIEWQLFSHSNLARHVSDLHRSCESQGFSDLWQRLHATQRTWITAKVFWHVFCGKESCKRCDAKFIMSAHHENQALFW